MYKYHRIVVATFLLLGLHSAGMTESQNQATVPEYPPSDQRQFVEMPANARQVMRQHMLEHLAALNQILGFLVEGKLEKAAEVAETQMGISSMGKHRGTGMGPGLFMPVEMRQMGWKMHQSASEFARIAKKGNISEAYTALQKVTATCVACHYNYRTQ